MILPLSSMSEVLGIKTVLLSAKCSGTVPPSNRYLQALKRNWEPSPPAHLQAPYGIPSGQGAESCQWSSGCRQELFEQIVDILVLVMSHPTRAWTMDPQYPQSLLPD